MVEGWEGKLIIILKTKDFYKRSFPYFIICGAIRIFFSCNADII